MVNPLRSIDALPAFEHIRPEHVAPAIRELIARNRELIERLTAVQDPTFERVVEPLEAMQHQLTRTWSPVSHMNAVVNSAELREQYNECLPLLSAYQTDLAQSEPIYSAYAAVAEREGARLDPVQRRVIEQTLRDFRLAGVALDPERKARFKQVMLELTTLQAKFEENVLDATNAWSHHLTDEAALEGLNESIVEQARTRANEKGLAGWLLTLDQPTYVSVITDAGSRELRRAYYEAWNTRASDQGPLAGQWDNSPVIESILALRHEAAKLLGYANYAEYALATRMAKSVPEVIAFLERIAKAARPAAQKEFAELEAFAGVKLEPWDVGYWSERLQRSRYSISQEALRPYFPLPRVLAGLFGVAERLFGLRIRESHDAPVWHADARYFVIESGEGRHLGSFYLDPYARPHKRSGAWMDECIGRRVFAGAHVAPVAYLVCNFLPPSQGQPALLTHDDVLTLFHEFGHGLHHLLTQVAYPSLAGINGVAWDAVELPSQFLENYAWNEEVLASISGHWQSGAPLPAETQRQLIATRSFHAGLATVRQVEFALFDFRLHAEYVPGAASRVLPLLAEVRRQVGVVPVPEWNRMPQGFGHVFAGGYAAGYYSYKWAEVLSADAFAAFEETGIFDTATAGRFLDSILSRGGSRDALEAFTEFRGREPDIAPLLKQSGIAS